MKELNVVGLACPQPVILTKRAIEDGETEILVITDSTVTVENIKRLAEKMHFHAEVEADAEGTEFRIRLTHKEASASEVDSAREAGKRVIFLVPSNVIGRGDDKLGEVLLKAFLKTLLDVPTPQKVIFLNTGVKLTVAGASTVEAIKEIEAGGAEILVCGTCLDFFGIKDKLAVGRVSNFFEITESLMEADKVISF